MLLGHIIERERERECGNDFCVDADYYYCGHGTGSLTHKTKTTSFSSLSDASRFTWPTSLQLNYPCEFCRHKVPITSIVYCVNPHVSQAIGWLCYMHKNQDEMNHHCFQLNLLVRIVGLWYWSGVLRRNFYVNLFTISWWLCCLHKNQY